MHFLWEILWKIIAGSFRVSLFIDLGVPMRFRERGGGDTLAPFMISRPI